MPQILELAAVVRVFQRWDTPINIVTDSAYVANLVQNIENSCLKDVNNPLLYSLMHTLLRLLNNRKTSYFIVHIRAHTALPGPLVEGNRRADALTLVAQVVPNVFEQARLSHAFYHQTARAIKKQFSLSRRQAKDIIATCPECQKDSLSSTASGVNPWGIASLELWQSDVTHFAAFGMLKYVHVSVDTFSGAVFVSCHTGEKPRNVRRHFLAAFVPWACHDRLSQKMDLLIFLLLFFISFNSGESSI